jgi:hypothetical protein
MSSNVLPAARDDKLTQGDHRRFGNGRPFGRAPGGPTFSAMPASSKKALVGAMLANLGHRRHQVRGRQPDEQHPTR